MQVVLQPAALRLVPLALALAEGTRSATCRARATPSPTISRTSGSRSRRSTTRRCAAATSTATRAIVVGIRAYNTRAGAAQRARAPDALRRAAAARVVVQYNTNNRLAPLERPIGPYPLTIGRDRVTDETRGDDGGRPEAPVAAHAERDRPRRLRGWVQERGLYFAEKWDARYEPIFRADDPGEEPLARRPARRRATGRGATSTPASPSSGSSRPACRARTACSRTCSRAGEHERDAAATPTSRRRSSAAGATSTCVLLVELAALVARLLRAHAVGLVSALDWVVLVGTIGFIGVYGAWKTRACSDMEGYFRGGNTLRWPTIGLSIMATQASAITFLSTPGQAYEDGMRFVQFYFGLPLAMIVISAVFVPIYYRLKVYTAYEYLEHRFDARVRYLGAVLFLIQRGLAAGITIYAPAIILSAILGWPLGVDQRRDRRRGDRLHRLRRHARRSARRRSSR